MCSCYSFFTPAKAYSLFERLGVDLSRLPETHPLYRIRPRDTAPVVLAEPGDGPTVVLQMTWGLLPRRAKDPAEMGRHFNARQETAWSKPLFREAARKRRCLVPANGFFEWVPCAHGKQPWYFSSGEDRILLFAGLWDSWFDPARPGSAECLTYTILTREADPAFSTYHSRQPVTLEPADAIQWLRESTPQNELHPLVQPGDPVQLNAHPVSTSLLREHPGPHSIQPVPLPPTQGELF